MRDRTATRTKLKGKGRCFFTVPSGSAPSTRLWSLVEQGPVDTPVKATTTPDFPLRVVAAVKRTGNAGQARIHLLNAEGTAVGCGWSKIQELSVLDYMSEPEAYGKCERCFKRYGFPADWVLEPAEVPTLQEDSSADSGSETDDSVDVSWRPRWWPYLWKPRCPRPWRPEGEAKDRALLSTDWHPSEMVGVPDCPSEMALSVCTPVLQFLRVCGGWPMGPTQP